MEAQILKIEDIADILGDIDNDLAKELWAIELQVLSDIDVLIHPNISEDDYHKDPELYELLLVLVAKNVAKLAGKFNIAKKLYEQAEAITQRLRLKYQTKSND